MSSRPAWATAATRAGEFDGGATIVVPVYLARSPRPGRIRRARSTGTSSHGAGARPHALTDVDHVAGAVVRVDNVNNINVKKGTAVSVRAFDFGGLAISTTPGYDTKTGLGVPAGIAFLQHV